MSDSERVSKVIEKMGYTLTDDEKEADLLGIMSCSVRQKAIDKVYSRISLWNKWKNKKNLITFVSGCVLPADKLKFLKLFDLVFAPAEIEKLPEMLNEYGITSGFSVQNNLTEGIHSFWNINPDYQSKFNAFVPIQNGCDKFCTFCAVPYTRGREVSRPAKEILAEVKQLVGNGYKSVTLLGQNVNSYGLDKNGEEITFAELLGQIGEYGKNSGKAFWIYFTSPHPRDMGNDVIDMVSKYDCLAKQIHLPLQSGDEKVLARMNRKHSLARYRKIVNYIREKIPQATLFTDIIVGFTGETEQEFENTRLAMEEFKYNMAYIAKYSVRPGAASSRWADDVTLESKKERLALLTEELKKHTSLYNQNLIGKKLTVLVYGKSRKEEYVTALTEGRLNVRFKGNATELEGKFVAVTITEATAFSLQAELAENTQPSENHAYSLNS